MELKTVFQCENPTGLMTGQKDTAVMDGPDCDRADCDMETERNVLSWVFGTEIVAPGADTLNELVGGHQ